MWFRDKLLGLHKDTQKTPLEAGFFIVTFTGFLLRCGYESLIEYGSFGTRVYVTSGLSSGGATTQTGGHRANP
jgi:hypothetical protein